MSVKQVFTVENTDEFSKFMKVDPGFALVVHGVNFACPTTDEYGTKLSEGDCALLHHVVLSSDEVPTTSGCTVCDLSSLGSDILYSEVVEHCGEPWMLNATNNVAILSTPGWYMFELCNPESIGSVVITSEEIKVSEGSLLPRNLIFGE